MYAMNDGTVFHEPVYVGITKPLLRGKLKITAGDEYLLMDNARKVTDRTILIASDEVTWCVCAALLEEILFVELNIN